MRRIETTYAMNYDLGGEEVCVSKRDYLLMRAAIRALERIARAPSPECARDPFLCKAWARQAVGAFNAPGRRK